MTNKPGYNIESEVISTFVKGGEKHTKMSPVDTVEGLRLFSTVRAEGIDEYTYTGVWGNPYDRVGSDKMSQEYILKCVRGLIKQGYTEQLLNYLIGFKAELDISSIQEIRLNSQAYSNLSKDSKRKVVLFKVIQKLEKIYNPEYIEYSNNELKEKGIELKEFKREKLNNSNEESLIHFIDTDEINTEQKLEEEKYRLKIKFLIEQINSMISFFLQYSDDIKKNGSLATMLKVDTKTFGKSLMSQFKELFLSNEDYNINHVLDFLNSVSDKERSHLITMMKVAGMTKQQAYKIVSGNVVGATNDNNDQIDISNKLDFNIEPMNGSTPGFLPFSNDFGPEAFMGMSAFLSFNQAKTLYRERFSKMVEHFTEKLDMDQPSHTSLTKTGLHTLQTLGQRGGIYTGELDKDNVDIHQCNICFDVDDFSKQEIINLANFLSETIGDFKLESKSFLIGKGYHKNTFDSESELKCDGVFENDGALENTNLLLLESPDTGKKSLHVNISSFSLDKYIFTAVQTAHYIKHKTFVDSKTLYANIYQLYNEDYIDGAEIFDIKEYDEQYREFIKHVIAANSIEFNGKIKPSHTILMGTQGTGKSQFILNLIMKRAFEYRGTNFTLNSLVIPIDLVQLMSLIEKGDTSYIKNRLRDIQENTGLPLIIAVEDICTLIEEDEGTGKSNLVSQALTTIFEGVGSLPNVTMVSTTNYPEKLPPRLTRKGRFECLIEFMPIDNEGQITSFFKTHIERKGLQEILSENFINKYKSKFIGTTPSHIANFIEEIDKEVTFLKGIGEDGVINNEDIEEIFDKLNFSIDSINKRKEDMERWLKGLRTKEAKSNMGFIQDK